MVLKTYERFGPQRFIYAGDTVNLIWEVGIGNVDSPNPDVLTRLHSQLRSCPPSSDGNFNRLVCVGLSGPATSSLGGSLSGDSVLSKGPV